MKTSVNRERNIGIDILKVLALFFVISVHFFLHTGYYRVQFQPLAIPFIIIRNISFTCVPLFLIITGYLSGNKTWNKKYFLNLLNVFLIYSLATLFCTLVAEKFSLSIATAVLVLKNIFRFGYYGWYVQMYLGLMLVAPVFNTIYKKLKSHKAKLIFILLLLAIVSFPVSFLDIFYQHNDALLLHSLPSWWKFTLPILYYSLGLYLREHSRKYARNIGLPLVLVITLSTICYYIFDIHTEHLTNIFTILTGIFIFYYFFIQNPLFQIDIKD
ncbi:acyltransferase family protein [Streptococcus oricebi]|nr:acyltransferase family protein [Streptococcus oricebi]